MRDLRGVVRRWSTLLTCAVLTGLGVFALVAPGSWLFSQPTTVETRTVVMSLLAITGLALASATRRAIVADGVLVIATAAAIAVARLEVGLGDDSWRTLATDRSGELWVSSYLGHLALRGVFRFAVDLEVVGIGLAIATLLASVLLARVSSPAPSDGWSLFATRATVLTVSMWFVFIDGLVETTPFSVPVGLLGLAALIRWEQTRSPPHLALASGLLALASAFHGQWLITIPMLAAVVVLRTRAPVRDVSTSAAAAIAVFAIVAVVTMPILGYSPTAGDSGGGGDGQILPPDLVSIDHLTRVGSILMLASPLVVTALLSCVGRRDRPLVSASATMSALAYLAFIVGWHFDFGYPKDLDLMVSMSGLLLPVVCAAIARLRPPLAALVVVAGASVNGLLLTAVVA